MTTTTTEQTKTDWTQARDDNKQRAARVREILKAAALETFSEVKAGSADLNVLTRKSMDTWLEEQATAAKSVESVNNVDAQPADAMNTEGEAAIPTWRELILRSFGIVRDRKGDWLQQFRNHLKEQAAKFDADMSEEKGDRYRKVKSVFQRLIAWVESNRNQVTQETPSQEAEPVNIEVIDENGTVVNMEQKAQ
ncbi:MAG: hypothetical protein ACFBSF_04160 [Leptolyngbyaceae cyanobacterium]